jgi:NDP-sugar pyrophosphorylase family protein
MPIVALLMAGGRGERMRSSGVDVPKPLVLVRGVPLIERNLRYLLGHGFEDVAVAVAAGSSVGEYVKEELAPLASAAGARLRVLTEDLPLGNIGAAGMLRGEGDVVTVYADNLTSLDLKQVLNHHVASGAALTLAAHDEPFPLPYGRLDIEDGRVVAYTEKPTLAITVSSAIVVLGPDAVELLPSDRPTGLVDLTGELVRRGLPVSAFRHSALWVDVNDAADVDRAEALLEQHAAEFAWPASA